MPQQYGLLSFLFILLRCYFLVPAINAVPSPSKIPRHSGRSIPLQRVFHNQTILANESFLQPAGGVPLLNMHQYTYVARISIGGQDLQVILDTGSSDLWVLSEDCTEPDCTGLSKYSKTSSFQTSSAEFELNYLVGSVSGTIGFESVTFGSYQVTSQVFALVNETHNLDLSSSEYSGILGLSFPLAASIASNTGKTLLENLFSYFDDSHRFFAFKLGRELDDSSFTLGQLDPAIGNSTEDFTYTAVYPGRNSVPDYWKLPLRSITLNSTTFFTSLAPSRVHDSTTPIAVLDTGTSFILGPSSDVDALWNAVGATRKTDSGQWQVRCNRAVTIGFVLGDHESMKEYPVDPADINLQGVDPEGWCIAGIQPSDKINSGDWILGDAFLRNVYVVHHGSTAQRPPLIGLLTMTEPTSALLRFQQERGSDSEAPIEGHSIDAHHEKHPKLSSGAICGIIATGTFLVGGSGTLLFQIYKSYRKREGKETTS